MDTTADHKSTLLAKAIDGDRDALGSLLMMSDGLLREVVQAELGVAMRAKIDPADIVQDAFRTAFQTFDGFRDADLGAFFAWLKTIAKHRTADEIKRLRRRKRGGDAHRITVGHDAVSSIANSLGAFMPETHTPSRSAARRELPDIIKIAMADLSQDEQAVIVLRLHERLPWEEAAAQIHRTAPAARALYGRALDKLRDSLGRMSKYLST